MIKVSRGTPSPDKKEGFIMKATISFSELSFTGYCADVWGDLCWLTTEDATAAWGEWLANRHDRLVSCLKDVNENGTVVTSDGTVFTFDEFAEYLKAQTQKGLVPKVYLDGASGSVLYFEPIVSDLTFKIQ